LRRSAKVLLDSVNVTINPGEHVGLIGRNGAGKSSLFALLNGSLHEDGGDFQVPAHWRMAQVAQNMPETDESATDFVSPATPAWANCRRNWPVPRPTTTAWPSPMPTPTCTTPGPTTPCPVPRR